MSPLNRGSLLGPRAPVGAPRPLLPRFAGRHPPGMPPRMPPPINPMFGPMRQRLPMPPRPGSIPRVGGPPPPPPPLMFNPRGRGMPPPGPPLGMRAPPPRGPLMRPWPVPHPGPTRMRPRYMGNGNVKGKGANSKKIVSKLEELELKKPWMTDEIRSEIQKKNKLYAKAKKNKDAKEWEEFKDLRNKVTRMIRDAKNEYLAKHPDQGNKKKADNSTIDSEGVQKTDKTTEKSEQMEVKEETQPSSEQAKS